MNTAHIYDPILKFENINAENSTLAKHWQVLFIGANRPYEAYHVELKSNYDHNRLSQIKADTVPFKFKAFEYYEDDGWSSLIYDISDFSFDLT